MPHISESKYSVSVTHHFSRLFALQNSTEKDKKEECVRNRESERAGEKVKEGDRER